MAPGRGKPTQAASVLHTDEVARISDKTEMIQARNSRTIAIDATPAFFTLAWLTSSEGSVIAVRKGVAF